MPTWPSTLPQQPENDGYAERPGDPVLRSPVDGPALTRLLYTAVPKGYALSFFVETEDEVDIFDAWYKTDIAYGSIPYDWRERGNPAKPVKQFSIITEPTYESAGNGNWRIKFEAIKHP